MIFVAARLRGWRGARAARRRGSGGRILARVSSRVAARRGPRSRRLRGEASRRGRAGGRREPLLPGWWEKRATLAPFAGRGRSGAHLDHAGAVIAHEGGDLAFVGHLGSLRGGGAGEVSVRLAAGVRAVGTRSVEGGEKRSTDVARAPETTGTRDAFETELARGRAARARLGRGARGNRAADAPFLRSSSEKRRRARRSLGVGSERARGPNGVSRRGGAKRSGRLVACVPSRARLSNTFGRSRSNARRRDFTDRFDGQSVGRRGKPDPIGLRA